MTTHVDFETAKLLKEKGYRILPDFNSSYPTIAEVVMWLYEKHGIWIWVERYSTLFRPYAEETGDKIFGKWEGHKFDSPTEAYLEAIHYTLAIL